MRAAAVLSIIRDGETIRKVPVEGEAMLGRGEGCLIRLDDRAISRQHALFKAVGDGVQVERKSEFAPLTVNGEDCTRAVLKEGDVIALGPYLVKLSINRGREEGAAPRSSDLEGRSGSAETSSPVTVPVAASGAGHSVRDAAALGAGVIVGAPMPLPPSDALAAFTNPPPVLTEEVARNGSALDLSGPLQFQAVGGPDPSVDLGAAGGLELIEGGNAQADAQGGGLALPGAPMDAAAFALAEASGSGETGPFDPDAETRALPVADLRGKLVLVSGNAPKKEYDLNKSEISIGRGKDCDVSLDDKKVSRRNTVIAKHGNRFVVRDLGSANGTYLNGKAVSEEVLFGDDVIRVGNEEFQFQALSESYSRREKDFMAVTQGSMVAPGMDSPDISLPPPIEGGHSGGHQSDATPAEISIPSDLHASPGGAGVLYTVTPSNMIPTGDGAGHAPSDPYGAVASMGQMQTGAHQPHAAIPGLGDPVANPLGIPGLTGLPGGSTKPKGIFARINALPPRRRMIAIAMIIAIVYFGLFDDDDAPMVQGRKKGPAKTPVAAATLVPDAKTGLSFDGLSPEKKQYIEAEHQLAFDHYRNQEYEKALHEVQKIFDIIPDYKDSREIERYAKEGLRKQEAQEEERRRKQDDERRKQQIEQILGQIRNRMAKKDYAAARELFARVIELDPENQAIAQWKKEIDDWEEQLRIKDQEKHVQDEINGRAWDIFKEGMALKKRGKYHAAIATFARVPDVGASDRRVLASARTMIVTCKAIIKARRDPVLKGAHAAEDGAQYKQALDLYEQATKIDPPHPEGWAGISRVKQILHDKSKVTYTEAVLAESYSDFDTARRKYQEIVDNSAKDDEYHSRAIRKLEKYIGMRGLAGGDSGGDGSQGAPAPTGGADGGGQK